MEVTDEQFQEMAFGIRPYLAALDPAALKGRIAAYEKLARTKRTREQIRNDINNVLLSGNKSLGISIPCGTGKIPAGSKLYRARIIDDPSEIATIRDVWEAPSQWVKAGRLNIPREPLIYTGVYHQTTAAYEVRIEPGQLFAMIEYVARFDINYATIGNYPRTKYFSLAEEKKLDLIFGFLEDAFTQRAHPDEAHVYVAPEVIVKEYFDWPVEVSQAWGYRSVVAPDGNGYNLCFRPDVARTYLHFNNVVISTCTRVDELGVGFDYHCVLAASGASSELHVIRSSSNELER